MHTFVDREPSEDAQGAYAVVLTPIQRGRVDSILVRDIHAEQNGSTLSLLHSTGVVFPSGEQASDRYWTAFPEGRLAAGGTASAVIDVSVALGERYEGAAWLRPPISTGQLALTLHVTHVLVGMSVLDAMGSLGNQTMPEAMAGISVFCVGGSRILRIAAKTIPAGPSRSVHAPSGTAAAPACPAGVPYPARVLPTAGRPVSMSYTHGLNLLSEEVASAQGLLALPRGHWQVESASHYRCDFAQGEDSRQILTGLGPSKAAVVNNLALTLL